MLRSQQPEQRNPIWGIWGGLATTDHLTYLQSLVRTRTITPSKTPDSPSSPASCRTSWDALTAAAAAAPAAFQSHPMGAVNARDVTRATRRSMESYATANCELEQDARTMGVEDVWRY